MTLSNEIRSNSVSKTCLICAKNTPISGSHVIPKFVFRWMIETGGTKFLRHGSTPNRRVQDGIKYPLLCTKCETLVSLTEKAFSERFFIPSTKSGEIPKKSNKEIYDFVASTHLRIISYFSKEGKFGELTEADRALQLDAIDRIGLYLNNERHSCSPIKFYLIPFGLGTSESFAGMPTNWHRYIRRHSEMDTIVTDKGSLSASYFKIGPWLSFAHLKNSGQPWIGGEIVRSTSKFFVGHHVYPPTLIDFLHARARMAQRLLSELSEKQKSIIEAAILKGDILNAGRPMYEAIMADYDAFGDAAFK